MKHDGVRPLTARDTHGILWRGEHRVVASSDRLGWTTLYASRQFEQPYADHYPAKDDYLIVMHLDGPVTVERDLSGDRKRATVHQGGLFLLPAGRDFGVSLDGRLETLHIYVRGDLLRRMALELCHGDGDAVEIIPKLGTYDPVIEQLGRTCLAMLADGQPDFVADGVARVLAARLVTCHSTGRVRSTPGGRGLTAVQVEKIRDLAHERLDEPLTVDEMAQAIGLDAAYFTRQFKRETGKSPHQFVIEMRLDRARALLSTQIPIAEVAVMTGFCHQEYLTRMFGRHFGITPGAYRKQAVH